MHQKSNAALLFKFWQLRNQKSQAGFTIIESLMAIIVVAILLSATAPIIVLSTATRLQARRVELATQAAKTYIDGVVAGSIDAPDAAAGDIASQSAPTASSVTSCDSGKYCSTTVKNLYCVDGDNNGKCTNNNSRDFIVQAFRTSGDAAKGYALGLRVYRADAFRDSGALEVSKNSGKQNTFTGGLGKRKTPLVEMTTDVVTENSTFIDFCNRLKNTGNTQSKC